MRPYPADVPHDSTSEDAWDCREARTHLARLNKSSDAPISDDEIADASSLSELTELFSEKQTELEEKAVTDELERAVEDYVFDFREEAEAIAADDAKYTQISKALSDIRSRVDDAFQYEDKVKDDEHLIEMIREKA